jgi:predicted amidophosphoribosyltransferase
MLVNICTQCKTKLATHGEVCESCFEELYSVIPVAEKLYYEANPDTKMDVPSSVYEKVEVWAKKWMLDTEGLSLYAWIKKYKS